MDVGEHVRGGEERSYLKDWTLVLTLYRGDLRAASSSQLTPKPWAVVQETSIISTTAARERGAEAHGMTIQDGATTRSFLGILGD